MEKKNKEEVPLFLKVFPFFLKVFPFLFVGLEQEILYNYI